MKSFDFVNFSMNIFDTDVRDKFNSLTDEEIIKKILEDLNDLGVHICFDEYVVSGSSARNFEQEEEDRLMEQGEKMNEEKWLQEQGL